MAQDMYMNPESIRPKYGWQPQGFLAGMWSQQDRQRYQDMASLQDMMAQMAAQKEEEELVQGAPVRAAQRQQQMSAADLATLLAKAKMRQPGFGQAAARGAMGEFGQQEAKGQYDLATLAARIKLDNLKKGVEATESDILRQRYAESSDPFGDLIRSPAHLRTLEGKDKDYTRTMDERREQSRSAAEVARIGAGATVQAARERTTSENLSQAAAGAFNRVTSGQTKPGDIELASMYFQERVENLPRMKQLASMMMLENLSAKDKAEIGQQMDQMGARVWAQMAPGALKSLNPYGRGGPNPVAGQGSILGPDGKPIPGVRRK